MSSYLNKPANHNSPEVVEEARQEIRQRAWARVNGQSLTEHLQAAEQGITDYLDDLDRRNLIDGTIRNYLRAVMEVELGHVQKAADGERE
jgi:hypothetical protein